MKIPPGLLQNTFFIRQIMWKIYQDHTPGVSLSALFVLCFVTIVMSQTRFKVTKEVRREVTPPVLRSKDCWFLYTIGNPDRFRCVLRAFVVVSSPILSLITTGLLLIGKAKSNPYYFIPWLFFTFKGLVLIQSDNLITILKDMATKTNYVYGFRVEEMKWMVLYFSIFLIDVVEALSFFEIFDLFLVLWNHHPGYNPESVSLEVLKTEITEIMETFSKCSFGSLSKISLGSNAESADDLQSSSKKSKLSIRQELEKKILSRGDFSSKENFSEPIKTITAETEYSVSKTNFVEGDAGTSFTTQRIEELQGATDVFGLSEVGLLNKIEEENENSERSGSEN